MIGDFIIYKGKILQKGEGYHKFYRDQLSQKSIWIHSRSFTRYIYKTYKIDMKTYYNFVIFGENVTPTCPICSKSPLVWCSESNWIRGYSSICDSSSCKGILSSSVQCKMSIEEAKLKYFRTTRFSNMKYYEKVFRRQRNSIINSPGTYYLYSIEDEYLCKIGVTKSLYGRLHTLQRTECFIHYEGNELIIANLEYLIKKLLNLKSEFNNPGEFTYEDISKLTIMICHRLSYEIQPIKRYNKIKDIIY